jgi:hypothetical protein
MGPTGLTAVFGMGTGVAPPVWSPGIRPRGGQAARARGTIRCPVTPAFKAVKPREAGGKSCVASKERVEGVRSGIPTPGTSWTVVRSGGRHGVWSECAGNVSPGAVAGRRLDWGSRRAGDGSGWSSIRLLGLVRCGGRPPCTPSPSTWSSSRSLHSLRYRKPRLEEGFALRCLQRLSFPDLATRRCPERDSRHTRGRSSPILSY